MMPSDEDGILSREELLGGRFAPGRRANALLFAIESRTAQLVAESQQATALYLTKKVVEERETAFLEALAAGRDLPVPPAIQDLERYAPHWANLVSEVDASLRAALAHALGSKYAFTRKAVPGIRTALGLDEESVQRTYERFYKVPLSSIYAPGATRRDRVRWAMSGLAARLEGLPPFWVAFAVTLPVGSGLLALPIAIAEVGPLVGILLLVFFGLLNALTAAALAESVARSGTTRFGLGYLGQMVSEYLGKAGSVVLTIVMDANSFLVLIIFYIGFADTFQGATRLPAALWILCLFGVGLYFLSRKSLNSTIASTIVVATLNVALLVIIPLFALPHVQPANLAYVRIPFVAGQPFDPATLRLIFGVMLSNYFSHLLVANYGRAVLRRDPSARSWIWGVIAAIGLTTLISCLWVLLINGALSPQVLASHTGTALTALAGKVGPVVNWLGSVCVVLSLGMASIHISLGLLFLMEERLPAPSQDRLGSRRRFLVSISPVVAAFLAAEWLSITGRGSFAGLLGFVDAFSLPLVAGVFPVLLLVVTRRKGDFVPGLVLRLLGNPIVLAATYLVFVGGIFVYGLFIFESILERAITLLVGVVVLASTVVILRRGALAGRLVVELREDQTLGGRSTINLTASGRPLTTQVCLVDSLGEHPVRSANGQIPICGGLRFAAIQLPASEASELKVWVHTITPEWRSEALPARLCVRSDGRVEEFDLASRSGQIVLSNPGGACEVEIALAEPLIEEKRQHGSDK
jgi:amino acid permease